MTHTGSGSVNAAAFGRSLGIGIVGCGGRMGRQLMAGVLATPEARLVGGTERPGSPLVGQSLRALAGVGPGEEAGEEGAGEEEGMVGPAAALTVTTDAAALFAAADVVIDFTAPAATRLHADLAADSGTALVVGTTGMTADDVAVLSAAAARAPVVYAPNMSAGVTLLMTLVEQVARTLGEEFDIEIVEMHHRHKVDAPSGTALGLGRAAARGRGVDLDAAAVRVRDGHTGPRRAGQIGFATLRGGDVVGDHSVIFAAEGERLELTHKASSRTIFVRGALRAALWCRGRAPGLYDMRAVLGLED